MDIMESIKANEPMEKHDEIAIAYYMGLTNAVEIHKGMDEIYDTVFEDVFSSGLERFRDLTGNKDVSVTEFQELVNWLILHHAVQGIKEQIGSL